MKLNKISFFVVALIFIFGACTEPDNIVPTNTDWNGEEFPVGGGLLEVTTPSINYIVGETEGYKVEFGVQQGRENFTTKVEVYSTFYGTQTDDEGNKISVTSNEILFESFDITETVNHFRKFGFNYDTLVTDLQIDGTDLSSNDGDLSIGDYWEFRFVSTMQDGNQFENYKRVKIAVSTRFAGTYICSDLAYFRLGVQSPSYWLGDELTIESVDAITYKYYWGATIGWDAPLYFQIDPATNVITYPEEWDGVAQTLNGEPLTCLARNAGDLTNVAGLTTTPDLAVKDDVDGKDQLIMVYGYYTGGSGPREFYETLIKKVD